MSSRNLILIGMSGSGKSAVGRVVARRLGLPLFDTDEMIEAAAGKPIARIFADEGEDHFRDLERRAVAEACARGGAVVATGGGRDSAACHAGDSSARRVHCGAGSCSRNALRPHRRRPRGGRSLDGAAVAAGGGPAGGDPRPQSSTPDRVRAGPLDGPYRLPDCGRRGGRSAARLGALCPPRAAGCRGGRRPHGRRPLAAVVATETQHYPVFVESGGLARLGERMRDAGLRGAAYVISDANVAARYGQNAVESLRQAGFAATLHAVDAGETAKELATVAGLYDFLAAHRAERGQTLVALGGGVVGDMVGFTAATYLRGMPFVQAPTSLLAMVDASIGGKTGVNLRHGKNLVGAFYQPRLVLADTDTLRTLPPRALTEGWAEAIKHALILDAALLETFEREADRLLRLEPELTAAVVRRSAALKAEVVSQDEKETGLRAILNYGHTIGHALEAVSGYEHLLHGEAVAVGMHGAALISAGMGLLSAADVERQQTLLRRFGLPETAPGIDADAVLDRLLLDKKVQGGRNRWVLLTRLGQAEVRSDVPVELVERVVRGLVGA